VVKSQREHHPDEARGNGEYDQERVDEGRELGDQNQVNNRTDKSNPKPKLRNEEFMVVIKPRMFTRMFGGRRSQRRSSRFPSKAAKILGDRSDIYVQSLRCS